MQIALNALIGALAVALVGCGSPGSRSVFLGYAAPVAVATAIPLSEGQSAPLIRSQGGSLHVTLDVEPSFPYGSPEFAYGGRIGIAPTLRVLPGDTIYLTLNNRLPRTNFTANDVNLHFHGLQVSPNAPADDVMTMLAQPGQTLHYIIHVPNTQQPGLYWYHPHSHGEAYWQITSGMSGAIVVEGLRVRLPGLTGLRERILILRDVQNRPNIMAIPWYARMGTVGLQRFAAKKLGVGTFEPIDPDDAGPNRSCAPENGLHVTIEGTHDGAIPIASKERILLRVLNAAASRIFDLRIAGEQLGLVAMDGYPVAAYEGNPDVIWTDHVILPPGGRAEFIVTGKSRTTALRSSCYNSGPSGDRDPALILATLQPTPRSHTTRPALFHATRLAVSGSVLSIQRPVRYRTIRFSEDAKGFYINGQSFSMSRMKPTLVVHAGTLEEWTITNETDEVHAFHIHQVHFVILNVNGRRPKLRFWRDTALVPAQRHVGRVMKPGQITILIDFRNPIIKGEFPFHCHMLDHEDGGMMALIRVV